MSHRIVFLVSAALMFAATTAATAQTPQPPLGADKWSEDLKFFTDKFSASGIQLTRGIATRGAKDLDKLYPTFKPDVTALNADIPNLSEQEIVLRLMRIVASANVAHNSVHIPINMGFFRRLPISLFWYADGLAVIEASKDHADAIGARVLRIGTMTPDDAIAAVAPYVSHENDIGLHMSAPDLLVRRAMVEHLKLLDSSGRVPFILQKPGGEPFSLAIPVDDPRVPRIGIADVQHIAAPLFLTQPSSLYWYRYLPESQTFYIQYNRCQNDPKRPFAEFVREAITEADTKAAAHAIKRVVLDLRMNGGGDSRVIAPLKSALASRSKTLGPVYVLIGPFTFSSAQMAAVEFQDGLHATLVGAPTSEKLNSYGDIDIVSLPNSKLNISFSTKFFRLAKEGDRPELDPAILAPLTLADAIAGRDAALEAAISDPGRR